MKKSGILFLPTGALSLALLGILISAHGRALKVNVTGAVPWIDTTGGVPWIIPKIIHHTSLYSNPVEQKAAPTYITLVSWNSWRKFFPSPEYLTIVGTDEVLERCIEEEFPDFKSQWDMLHGVEKADAGRYCMLYKHGGIYADLDYEVRKNFWEELNANGGGYRVHLLEGCWVETRPEDGHIVQNVQNSLMASPPKHRFWKLVLEDMKKGGLMGHAWNAAHGTGPRMLSLQASKHASEEKMTVEFPCANFQRNGNSAAALPHCGNFMDLEPQVGIHWNQASWKTDPIYNIVYTDFVHRGFANAHPELGDVGLQRAKPEDLAMALDPPELALLLDPKPRKF